MIEEDGDDLKDFDYVSFDYHEGYFIEHMFSRPQILNGWGQGLIEIRWGFGKILEFISQKPDEVTLDFRRSTPNAFDNQLKPSWPFTIDIGSH